MLKLPDFDKINKVSRESNDSVMKRLLGNMELILQLEQDNKRLKNLLVKSQDLTEGNTQKRINELISVLHHKDEEFRKYKKKIDCDYQKLTANYNTQFTVEKKKNQALKRLHSEYKKLKIEHNKLRVRNAKIQFLLKKNFEKKLGVINDNLKLQHASHKSILKQHESDKINLKKELEVQKQKNAFLVNKYHNLLNLSKNIEEQNQKIKNLNNKLVQKIDYLDKNTLGNEKKLEEKTRAMKKELETKLKQITKQFLDKEIEYKARIDSLNIDLMKYFKELKDLRIKYHNKEKEVYEIKVRIKEKLNQII